MKTCTICGQEKTLSEFYRDNGAHRSKCGRKAACKDCQKKQFKIYSQSLAGRTKLRAYSKTDKSKARQERYGVRHPERRKAKGAVCTAIAAGRLQRPDTLPCHYCPEQANQYHHHQGYEQGQRLNVVPTCQQCHTKQHTTDTPNLVEAEK